MPLTRTKPMNRGTGFKPKAPAKAAKPKRDPDEFKSFRLKATTKAVMAGGLAERAPAAAVKEARFYSEAWRRAVASIPCVLCNRWNETQAAHRNEDKAGGKKLMDDCWTASLCVPCHSAIDQGKDFTREERRQRMDLAILLTIRALARAGKLKAIA